MYVWLLFVDLIVCMSFYQVLFIQAMVNAAGILSIRAEDTDLDENVKRRVGVKTENIKDWSMID